MNPRYRLELVDTASFDRGDAATAWQLTLDPGVEPAEAPWTMDLVGAFGMQTFDLTERSPVFVTLGPRPERP